MPVLVLSLVAALGLALGSVPLGGISLGIGGVLFAGLAFGYLGFTVDPHILHFVKEFGLILFIFTMGMQVGPGFFSSLRRQGLKLNALAAAIVLTGCPPDPGGGDHYWDANGDRGRTVCRRDD